MYIGTDGVYSYTFEHERRKDCPVCGGDELKVEIGEDWTVEKLIEYLADRQDMLVFIILHLPYAFFLLRTAHT